MATSTRLDVVPHCQRGRHPELREAGSVQARDEHTDDAKRDEDVTSDDEPLDGGGVADHHRNR